MLSQLIHLEHRSLHTNLHQEREWERNHQRGEVKEAFKTLQTMSIIF